MSLKDLPVAASAPSDLAVVDGDLAPADLAALGGAVSALERSTLAGRISTVVGKPIELLGQALPSVARDAVSAAVERALRTALRVAITTLPADKAAPRRDRLHTVLAAASGALGGALGLLTLPVELPVSTTVALRAIADIARQEGEDLSDPEVGLACLQVFALGSHASEDDFATSGYFAVRAAMAKTVQEVGRLAAGAGLADSAAPAVVRLLGQVASRFGVVVSQKVAAGAIPVVGAIGGAAVNAAFLEHFRAVARAHFTVRRLERRYGKDAVKTAYERLRDDKGAARAA